MPRLKQVVAWTEHLMQQFVYPPDKQNHGAIFRQINPVINGQHLYASEWGYTTWNLDVYELNNFRQALQLAFNHRDMEMGEAAGSFADFQSLGRILYLHTQLTTHDGAAIVDSNCFVDESDVPPIDTWFYFDDENANLFCWIPKKFETIMQAAIDVEMMGSYHWLDKAGPFTHKAIVTAMAL
ncbi:hypothetical protein [Hymenobacter cheonanensis]|uniref:hypothetical protein n=1 Tax=Hymenobacter sp. CA2-7 TaxID=3063993 RepID=UPI0027140C7D|nr:hypothetical protein [Hymenobacter sp. CA2-7]MDO7885449.1 hypothetical protein [Hymenobacter sp. CA2-7]